MRMRGLNSNPCFAAGVAWRITASIAHEINQPLGAILSDVIRRLRTLLRRRELELRPVHLKEVITEVLGLVRAAWTFMKPSAGKKTPCPSSFSPGMATS